MDEATRGAQQASEARNRVIFKVRAVISAQRSIQTGSPQLSRGIAGAEMVTRASDRGRKRASVPDGGDATGDGRRGRDGGKANFARGGAHRLHLDHLTGARLRGGARGECGLRGERAGGEPGEHHGDHLELRCAVRYASGGAECVWECLWCSQLTGTTSPKIRSKIRTVQSAPLLARESVGCRASAEGTRICEFSEPKKGNPRHAYAFQSQNFNQETDGG